MRYGLTTTGAILVLGLLAACGSGDDTTPSGDPEVTASSTTDTPFAQAASRISPDALGEQPYVVFGQTAELLSLNQTDQRWLSATTAGNQLLENLPAADSIGVDAAAADYSIEVGQFPSRVGVLAGGQDMDTITNAAKETGYEGNEVLTQELNPSATVTVSVQQIKPLEEDVVLATIDADVGWVDGGSLYADAEVGRVAVCLGDVVAAMIAEVNGEVIGVGLRTEGTEILSVLCIPGGSNAASDVEDDLTAAPFVDQFEVVDSGVVDQIAQVTVQHGADVPAGTMLAALTQKQLPGT